MTRPDTGTQNAHGALLAQIVRDDEHPALVAAADGDTVTYADLHEAVVRLAGELVAFGINPGDAVALSLANGPAMVLAFLAVVAAGAAAAPLNPGYTAAEFRSYLEDLRPRAMLFAGETAAVARGVCTELGIAVVDVRGGPARELSLDVKPVAAPSQDPDAVALLLHTSGTTSKPKTRAAAPAQPRALDAHDRAPLRARDRTT